jgi:hypothetical protein
MLCFAGLIFGEDRKGNENRGERVDFSGRA